MRCPQNHKRESEALCEPPDRMLEIELRSFVRTTTFNVGVISPGAEKRFLKVWSGWHKWVETKWL